MSTVSASARLAGSAMAHRPVVGDVVVEWIEPRAQGRIVRMRAAVGHDRKRLAHALEATPHARRDHGQRIVIRPEEDLLALAGAGRTLALVIQHELNAAEYARVVQSHLTMLVPALDDAVVDRREIDLAEFLEMRIRALEHVHDGA